MTSPATILVAPGSNAGLQFVIWLTPIQVAAIPMTPTISVTALTILQINIFRLCALIPIFLTPPSILNIQPCFLDHRFQCPELGYFCSPSYFADFHAFTAFSLLRRVPEQDLFYFSHITPALCRLAFFCMAMCFCLHFSNSSVSI